MTTLDFFAQSLERISPSYRSKARLTARAGAMVWFSLVVLTLSNSHWIVASAQVVGAQGRFIDSYLQRLSGFGYSGTVLVSVDGRIILRKGYGVADRENHIPIRPQTRFDIGSLSKNFTAAAILRLEADGKLRVEDTISTSLPDVPEDKRSISIHQLLTHTAGVTGPEYGYRAVAKE
jgi:CubicO group peptidase (beta-lactamase class C family)